MFLLPSYDLLEETKLDLHLLWKLLLLFVNLFFLFSLQTKKRTEEALGLMVEEKLAAAAPVRRAEKSAPAQYIRYTPSNQGTAFNSGAKQRVVRLVEAQKDPMEPPKFKWDPWDEKPPNLH